MEFKEITIESFEELLPYFELVQYKSCEYSFTTLYMWQHVYKTKYYIGEDYAILVGEYKGQIFSILPLATEEKLPEVIDVVFEMFKVKNCKIYLRGIEEKVVDLLNEMYPNKFEYIEERDLFDYIYDAESLRDLKGKKNQKKRNHINWFKKEYDGRYKIKKLEEEEDFKECLIVLKKWNEQKEETDLLEDIKDEFIGIEKLLNNYNILKTKITIFGVYIDEKLEAFSIGEMYTDDTVLIHIEKADGKIRGLYPFINQQFLIEVFPMAKFINREEDMGIEGLRKSKLSYHPIDFVKKYTVKCKEGFKDE